ncbi:MAG: GAF domain-containing protein [Planctomycetes bacterium]|nr:GAF domain-containing protein [Planctomycetota bacterium]
MALGAAVRAAFGQAATMARLAAPLGRTELVERIVLAAEHVVGANASGLFLVDEEAEELVAEIIHGGGGEDVRKFRLPLGQGIAGYVAATAQPIAISRAHEDPRWARDIGKAVAYAPKTILCVPMCRCDRVTGVLELLDKAGGQTFDGRDMELLGRFADLAAIALEQSVVVTNLEALLRVTLARIADPERPVGEELALHVKRMEESPSFREITEIAVHLAEIARRGDDARRLCLSIVEAVRSFLDSRPAP